jgi:hypothetical protein
MLERLRPGAAGPGGSRRTGNTPMWPAAVLPGQDRPFSLRIVRQPDASRRGGVVWPVSVKGVCGTTGGCCCVETIGPWELPAVTLRSMNSSPMR